MDMTNSRALRDYREIIKNYMLGEDQSFFIDPATSSYDNFTVTIDGPMLSPYETGKFFLHVVVPKEYPFEPPQVHFLTKVWHPNISNCDGSICLDILSKNWSSQLSYRTLLLSIQALLSAPEPDDPLEPMVGNQCVTNPDLYYLTAKVWTYIYANGSNTEDTLVEKLQFVMGKGYSKYVSLKSLSYCDWDVDKAIRQIRLYEEFNLPH